MTDAVPFFIICITSLVGVVSAEASLKGHKNGIRWSMHVLLR